MDTPADRPACEILSECSFFELLPRVTSYVLTRSQRLIRPAPPVCTPVCLEAAFRTRNFRSVFSKRNFFSNFFPNFFPNFFFEWPLNVIL